MVSKRGGAGGVSSALEDVRAAPWDPARRHYGPAGAFKQKITVSRFLPFYPRY